MRVHVGPVDAAAATAWTSQMLDNLERLLPARNRLPFQLPLEVAAAFEGLLRTWKEEAAGATVFDWSAEMDAGEVERLVQYWANLDSLSDKQVDALGLSWSSPDARPFFDALTAAVAEALAATDGSGDAFAALLVEHSRNPRPSAPSDG